MCQSPFPVIKIVMYFNQFSSANKLDTMRDLGDSVWFTLYD